MLPSSMYGRSTNAQQPETRLVFTFAKVRLVDVVIGMSSQHDLLEIVAALCDGGSFAHFLHGGQQYADQDGDDSGHHQ